MEVLGDCALLELKDALKEISVTELACNLQAQSDDRIIGMLYEAMRDSFIEVNPQYQKCSPNLNNTTEVNDGNKNM